MVQSRLPRFHGRATSLDVILADAYMKGVRNFDVDAAYKSMLRNATAYSYQNDRGRKGMDQMPFYGHKPGGGEAVPWSLEAYLNDFGISEIAKALGKTDDAAYLANRAQPAIPIFSIPLLQGTSADGCFRTKYTEWKLGRRTLVATDLGLRATPRAMPGPMLSLHRRTARAWPISMAGATS